MLFYSRNCWQQNWAPHHQNGVIFCDPPYLWPMTSPLINIDMITNCTMHLTRLLIVLCIIIYSHFHLIFLRKLRQFREWPFNTGGPEGCDNLVSNSKKNYNLPFMHMKKSNPLERVKKIQLPPFSSFYIHPNSIVFDENFLFITFIKNVCQWGMKINSIHLQGLKKNLNPPNFPDPLVSIKTATPLAKQIKHSWPIKTSTTFTKSCDFTLGKHYPWSFVANQQTCCMLIKVKQPYVVCQTSNVYNTYPIFKMSQWRYKKDDFMDPVHEPMPLMVWRNGRAVWKTMTGVRWTCYNNGLPAKWLVTRGLWAESDLFGKTMKVNSI